jgi:tetratricopeptide (TPR) repeat protein
MEQARFTLYVFGRLHGITRPRLASLVARAGGCLLQRPSLAATLVAVASQTSRALEAEGLSLPLPASLPANAELISERNVRRLLGLEPAASEPGTFDQTAVVAASGLESAVIEWLALFDVLDPLERRFAYRDLVAARQVRRLLSDGLSLADIVEAATVLRRAGRSLADTKVVETSTGELLQEIGRAHGRLDAQLILQLSDGGELLDDVFERAERCECDGDLAEAERWYRVALQMSRSDPVIPFNLGNVLDAAGQHEQALMAYGQALARDSAFAEAWVNIGTIREKQGRASDARQAYLNALSARSDCSEALYNLGLMLTWTEEYAEALPLWEWYSALPISSNEAAQANRLMQLCLLGKQVAAE